MDINFQLEIFHEGRWIKEGHLSYELVIRSEMDVTKNEVAVSSQGRVKTLYLGLVAIPECTVN